MSAALSSTVTTSLYTCVTLPQINKVDLAPAVGASLEVMRRDADLMRRARGGGQPGPWLFAQVGPAVSPQTEISTADAGAGIGAGAGVGGDAGAAEHIGVEGPSNTSAPGPGGAGLGVDEIVSHIEAALGAAGVFRRGSRNKGTINPVPVEGSTPARENA